MMTTILENSMTSNRMSLIKHRRRIFLLCKETGMQKWAKMIMKTGKALTDPRHWRNKWERTQTPPLTILFPLEMYEPVKKIFLHCWRHNSTNVIHCRRLMTFPQNKFCLTINISRTFQTKLESISNKRQMTLYKQCVLLGQFSFAANFF